MRSISVKNKLLLAVSIVFAFGLGWFSAAFFYAKLYQENLSQEPSSVRSSYFSDRIPEEFVLFTMPKTGTHFMRPFLEHLTGQNSVSYWSKEITFPKNYIYDKKMLSQLMLLPEVVQPYWLNQPIHKNTFISVLDDLLTNNDFIVTHAPFSVEMENTLKQRDCMVFFLIRDPRDWIVSVIKHPAISGVDIFGQPMGDRTFLALDNNQKIDYILNGTATYYSVLETMNMFLAWKKSPISCALRFEALLGPRGGTYSETEQLAELRKIADALYIDISDEELLSIFDESFGVGTVFSKGKAGTWKDYFNEEHKTRFKELMGDMLIELGYEQDYNW